MMRREGKRKKAAPFSEKTPPALSTDPPSCGIMKKITMEGGAFMPEKEHTGKRPLSVGLLAHV